MVPRTRRRETLAMPNGGGGGVKYTSISLAVRGKRFPSAGITPSSQFRHISHAFALRKGGTARRGRRRRGEKGKSIGRRAGIREAPPSVPHQRARTATALPRSASTNSAPDCYSGPTSAILYYANGSLARI